MNSYLFSLTSRLLVLFLILFFSNPVFCIDEKEKLNQQIIAPAGKIEDNFSSKSDLWIVHIKDAHCNFEAQINSTKIIQKLIDDFGFSLVCMEGCASPIDVSDLSSFPDKTIKDDVTMSFLKKGNINGVEYLSIIDHGKLVVEGIENKNLYTKNFNAFYKSLSFRKKAGKLIDDIKSYLNESKNTYFSDKLIELDSIYRQYQNAETDVFNLFDILKNFASSFQVSYKNLNNIKLLDEAIVLNKTIDFKKVEEEKDAIIKVFLKYSPKEDQQNIINTNIKYKFHQISIRDYHAFILKKCDEYLIEPDDYPNFNRYIMYSEILDKIDQRSLGNELDILTFDIKKRLFTNKESEFIDSFYWKCLMINQAFNLTMLPSGAEKLAQISDNFIADNLFNSLCSLNVSKKNHLTLEDLRFIKTVLSYVSEFYITAEKRNSEIINNTLRIMKKRNVKKCILYTGGFHTEGIKHLLKEKNISYSVVSPKIGNVTDDDPYFYLLTNSKDPFISSLERNLIQNIGSLALESKLVPVSEVMIDQSGAKAFRDQLKTFYFAGGIRKAISDLDSKILQAIMEANENELIKLSSRIKDLYNWKNKNFASLENFSITRNNESGLDLKVKINGEDFYIYNIVNQEQRKSFYMNKYNIDSPERLTTLRINGEPLSIYQSPSATNGFQINDKINESQLVTVLTAFNGNNTISEDDLSSKTKLNSVDLSNILNYAVSNGIITKNPDKTYSLTSNRSQAVIAASTLFLQKSETWKSITEIDNTIFPADFRNFLKKHNIIEIELSPSLSFPALLYMIEGLPPKFENKSVYPKNESDNFVFRKDSLIGKDGFRLSVSIEKNDLDIIRRERDILMGPDYDNILDTQLFGSLPSQFPQVLLESDVESPVLVLNNPGTSQKDTKQTGKSIVWANPEITEHFWREINNVSIDYAQDQFTVTGGLIFGRQIADQYLITNIIPLNHDDYEYQSEDNFTAKENTIRDLIDTYAIDGIKLIGIYKNHSVKRLFQLAQPGADRRDTFEGFPFDGTTDKVVDNPLGIVFEPRVSPKAIADFNKMDKVLPTMVIDPDSVQTYFYNIENDLPVIIHQESAVNIVNPGEKILSGTGRNLFLRRLKDKHPQQETDIVTFKRLPQNRGFAVIANQSISKDELQYFVQFFRSIRKEIENYTYINEIKIKSGMKNSAHSNKQDNIIEFNVNILEYPALCKYLAIPHEWNHFQLKLDEGTEELITIMLDLNRISELSIMDSDSTLQFIEELEKFEEPHNGKQLFFETIKRVIWQTQNANRKLSTKEIFTLATEFIKSDPELNTMISGVLNQKRDTYFMDLFSNFITTTQTELPSILPGESDYVVFDEDIFGSQQPSGNIIDFMMINVRYLNSDSFNLKSTVLNKSPEINFSDSTGYFDPAKKEIGINMTDPYHLNDDATVNPDAILSTIIHQRTHHFIHQNKNMLNTILDKAFKDTKTRNEIIRLFYMFKKGQNISTITQTQLNELATDPVFGSQNAVNMEKILTELICCINGYNAIPTVLNKFNDIKEKLEKDKMTVPLSLETRIKNLNDYILSFDRLNVYSSSEEAEKYILGLDENIAPAFSIPNLSTLHIYLLDDKSQVADIENLAAPFSVPDIEIPVTGQGKQNLITLTQNHIEIEKLNSFLHAMRLNLPNLPSSATTYTREIAYQNAQEFYDFLRNKYMESKDTSLPAEINIVDLYLGFPEFAKDFLDKFREIDINRLFYRRLRYNITSHSQTSKTMLNELEKSGFLKDHNLIVRFNPYSSLKDIKFANPLLVRAFGDTTNIDNVLLLEKKNNDFYQIALQPLADSSKVNPQDIEKLKTLLETPDSVKPKALSDLPVNILDNLSFSEVSAPVNIDSIPFGLFLKSFAESKPTGKFIYHPQLLSFVQETLSNMSLKFGGYIQFFGTSLNSLDPSIQKEQNGLTELDSLFISAMMNKQGGFISESQHNYLTRRIKNTPVSTLSDGLRDLPAQELAQVLPSVSFADIANAARIFNLRQDASYKTTDNFTFQRFVRDIKQKALFPQNIMPQLIKDPAGKDDFIYSLNEAAKGISTLHIAESVLNTLKNTQLTNEVEILGDLKNQSFIKTNMISNDYLKRVLTVLYTLVKDQKNFHIRAEVIAPQKEAILTDPNQKVNPENQSVLVRRLTTQQFQAYIEEIKRDNPYIDFGDPRGIANPITGEIVINKDHPAHKDKNGIVNVAEIRQTLIHEKSHMLIFANWNLLTQIANDLKGKEYEKDEILKLFYEFYFDEKIEKISREHKDRLKVDPLWSENGEISYERILSELLAIINQYQMLPSIMKRLSTVQTKFIIRNKAVPDTIKLAVEHLTEMFKNKRTLIASTVTARTKLKAIDPRISQNFIFNAVQLKTPLNMIDIERNSLPLPSTPIKTVFSFDELESKVTAMWEQLGNGDINTGKSKTILTAFQINEFTATIDKLKQISSKSDSETQDKLNKIIEFWTNSLDENRIHIYPTSPESYTITGTHFIHTTKNKDIILPSGFYNYLKNKEYLANALVMLGAKELSINTDGFINLFGGDSIAKIEENLYNQYLKNRDYLPVIEAILKLYGITINELSQNALLEIVDKYEDILKIPGAAQHLQKVKDIITNNTILDYKQSPIAEAFEIYASASLSPNEVNTLKNTAIEISALISRETSPPVIFLIDSNAISGPVSPQNFAIRETLGRIRNEIESIGQRNTIIIAVDLNGKTAGEIRTNLDSSLLRKGGSSDDFDYVASFKSSVELMNALKEEYPNFNETILKANIKVLAVENDLLIDLAKENGIQYREINENYSATKVAGGEGLFLIDYLRSLGLNNFLTADDKSDMAVELRNSIYVMDIPATIDLTGIPETLKPLIGKFVEKVKSAKSDSSFTDIRDNFIAEQKIEPSDIDFLNPLLEEQFQLTKINMLFDTLYSEKNDNIDMIINIFQKLQQAFAETDSPHLQNVVEKFYIKLNDKESGFLYEHNKVINELIREGKASESISQNDLATLYISKLINRDNLSESELFSVECRIIKGLSHNPIQFGKLMDSIDQEDIAISPQINRYFIVDTAPRKIQKELRTLITTQKLFDESA